MQQGFVPFLRGRGHVPARLDAVPLAAAPAGAAARGVLAAAHETRRAQVRFFFIHPKARQDEARQAL